MDPCPFIRVLVGNLSFASPNPSIPSRHSGVRPSTTPCFCKIRLGGLPPKTAAVHLSAPDAPLSNESALTLAAVFDLGPSDVEKLVGKSIFKRKKATVKVAVYAGSKGTSCGVGPGGRLIGKVKVGLDLRGVEGKSCVFHDGWVTLGKKKNNNNNNNATVKGGGGGTEENAMVHVTIMSEPDPRFVFEFDGEPECSPQVFQVQGSMRQPMFTCTFNLRSPSIRTPRSVSLSSSTSRRWLGSFGSERERLSRRDRKGWSVTVHDLSGSPLASASMVTPFVASPGSDHVSGSNPGAWLLLRPSDGTWYPWARLEAWRVCDDLALRFQLCNNDTTLSSVSDISTTRGGKFTVHSSPPNSAKRFVMSVTVEGEGKCSKPVVEIGIGNVGCSEDAAAFLALAAAVDLCMDACRLFTHKLRKEFTLSKDIVL